MTQSHTLAAAGSVKVAHAGALAVGPAAATSRAMSAEYPPITTM